MMKKSDYKFWFVVGSQFLYGEETLKQVDEDSIIITDGLNKSGVLPCEIVYKGTVKTSKGAEDIIKEASYDEIAAFSSRKKGMYSWYHNLNKFLDKVDKID